MFHDAAIFPPFCATIMRRNFKVRQSAAMNKYLFVGTRLLQTAYRFILVVSFPVWTFPRYGLRISIKKPLPSYDFSPVINMLRLRERWPLGNSLSCHTLGDTT